MKITLYKSVSNKDYGFFIQQNNGLDGDGKFAVWIDEFEGGEASEIDFTFLDDFDTENDALNYIVTNYGEIKKYKEF